MSNSYYYNRWQVSVNDLEEQIEIEGTNDESAHSKINDKREGIPLTQAFQHFACLYVKYLKIYKNLESCYDLVIQPQQRTSIKSLLELVIQRIIELRNEMVQWNPPNSHLRIMISDKELNFPWEIVHLDEILIDLKLSPDVLDVNIPRYFKEDNRQEIENRDNLVSAYMKLKHETDKIYVNDNYTSVFPESSPLTEADAIAIIQRMERGRQAQERVAKLMRMVNREEIAFTSQKLDKFRVQLTAALNIQRIFRGYKCRQIAATLRDRELEFLGMKPQYDNLAQLKHQMGINYVKRKHDQAESKISHQRSIVELKKTLIEEEGAVYSNRLRDERTRWMTDQIAQGKYHNSLDGYYESKESLLENINGSNAASASSVGVKSESKSQAESKKKIENKATDKNGKGTKKTPAPEKEIATPKLLNDSELTKNIAKMVEDFQNVWEIKEDSIISDDSTNQFKLVPGTKPFFDDLIKQQLRPSVYEQVRREVDELLVLNLKKLQILLKTATKKAKKDKSKKSKKSKKTKGPKKKLLPGEKIADLKGLDSNQMLSILIEHKLVVKSRNRTMDSFIGDFNYLGSVYHDSDRCTPGQWEPEDPSLSQIRQMLTDYCILPNGSPSIKSSLNGDNLLKSIMLYGPRGTGKTLATEIIANELGALLIHITPDKVKGLFPGKSGPTILVHMIMTIARDPTMQPVIINIDECEKFFSGGAKSKDREGPSRFKKDLVLYKKQALTNEHRCLIVGTSSEPEGGDMKDMKGFFDKFMFMPYPDYASRLSIWKYYLEINTKNGLYPETIDESPLKQLQISVQEVVKRENEISKHIFGVLKQVDISSLANVSVGYSAGSIAKAVRVVLTPRRLKMIQSRPLSSIDFLDHLSIQPVTYKDDREVFQKFIKSVTGIDERRKQIEALLTGSAGKSPVKGGSKKPLAKTNKTTKSM